MEKIIECEIDKMDRVFDAMTYQGWSLVSYEVKKYIVILIFVKG